MTRNTIYTTLAVFVLSASSAMACTAEDVQARQGALLEAVQALLATNPTKAQEIVVKMQTEMDAINTAGDDGAVCEMMDRLTTEAREAG